MEKNKDELVKQENPVTPPTQQPTVNADKKETPPTPPITGNGKQPGEQNQESQPTTNKNISDTPDKNDSEAETIKGQTAEQEEITDAESPDDTTTEDKGKSK